MLPEPSPKFNDEWWSDFLATQASVLHRREIPPEFARHANREIYARRWQRFGRDVFVAHNGPLDTVQRQRVALKISPPGSALAGLTAAAIDQLRGLSSDRVHVSIPCGARRPRLRDIEVHYSRFLSASDVHPARTPRRTRLPRSLVDAATWAENDERARMIVLAGIQQGLVSPQQLNEALATRGPCLRHALIGETIADAEGGVRSLPEAEFATIVGRYELPEPTRQHVLRHLDGRYYLDAYWEPFHLAVEVDGRPHMDVTLWDADLDRANEIVIDRRTLLRFTSYTIRRKPATVGTTLVRALTARGWQTS